MYIGIDLGTSGVKVVLLNEEQQIIATTQQSLPISRPHPLWSEQDPQDWWQATNKSHWLNRANARCDFVR